MKRSIVLMLVFILSACGSNGGGDPPSSPPPPPGTFPSLTTYTIGGTVSGLFGTGGGLVLKNNGGNNLTVNADGAFTFTTAVYAGFPYSVQVQTQPSSPAQTCTVTNGSGTANANVTNVQVVCKNTIGGTVSGLTNGGTVVLQNNLGNNLSLSNNGSFVFTTALGNGVAYSVTVLSSTPAQQCIVTANGSGTANANVTNVQVVCKNTIGGTISGLNGGTVVLRNNGVDDLTRITNGPFTFAIALDNPSPYDVTVLTHPSTPAQTCKVTNGSGTAGANITTVQVTCTNGQWAWMAGTKFARQAGVYGTQGTAAAANTPGGRFGAAGWIDAGGNLWLFGGQGVDLFGINGVGTRNDLWKFSGGQWTWVNGVQSINPSGAYGTKGTAAAGNVPGGRHGAVSWIDAGGNLWLFGGQGMDAAGSFGDLNDLWKFNISTGLWTWVSGANTRDQQGTYGAKGTPDPANVPGARHGSVSWIDAGNLWLFGGQDSDPTGLNSVEFNDLWKFNGTQWTWVSGANVGNSGGTYGTKGTANAANVPGARHSAVGWKDAGGALWLFGGYGVDSTGSVPFGRLNDLWKFNGTQWTWVSGANVHDQHGTYGTLGTAAAANVPGARFAAVSWIEGTDNLWLLGGDGYGAFGLASLNDLWKYSISTGQWTWVSGSTDFTPDGSYGALGVVAVGFPGGRAFATSWTDASGKLWLFGGMGKDSAGSLGELNDLWRFQPQ